MHKSAKVALDQLRRGAVGVLLPKVSEAEIMAEAGIRDILITNEIVSPAKLERLARLAKRAAISCPWMIAKQPWPSTPHAGLLARA